MIFLYFRGKIKWERSTIDDGENGDCLTSLVEKVIQISSKAKRTSLTRFQLCCALSKENLIVIKSNQNEKYLNC